ncbi:HAMP domain-containing sensor histidine kinase [Streptomyces sp. NBC_00878]|uniref:HAMP domain-containing sensor histidine kinase n=1 Tax=Streptomyces sp. NBC_00878 TaxID=2975854 RepID=UPI00224FE2D0|nr:HAMP domain-containing sensor histidine kinase [Streptomyces sp. NBC_00878]MCX4911218.1 HAMP domain-containing histidine kinase [Streptomyces sp. NBC_00878]
MARRAPARKILLRNSLLTRLLGTSLLIALLSIGSTAWLVVRSTTLSIEQERGQVLADDTSVQDTLTGYAARHRNWAGVTGTVRELAKKTGRDITLTTAGRRVIASSSEDGSRLPTRASAVIDPLRTPAAPGQGTGTDTSRIDARAVGPYELPVQEREKLGLLAREQVTCLADSGYRAQVVVRSSGRPDVRLTQPALPSVDDLCLPERLATPTRTEADALADLQELVEACAASRGVPNTQDVAIGLDFEAGYKGTAKESAIVEACGVEGLRDQLAPYVAPPALLFISTSSGPATPVVDLSPAGTARIAGVTGLVLAATFAVTIFIAIRLVRPLRALADAAQNPSERHVRVRVTSKDETGYLAAAFNDLSERRERTEEQRKAMVSDIAHELRTPLTNIRGWLEAAQDGIAVPDSALLSSLQEEAVLLQHIIDDLQILAAADAGTLRLHPERLLLRDVVEQVSGAHRAGAEAAGVTVLTHVTDDPAVDADPLRLRQALGNLMSNAVRHTPPGGRVTLSAHRAGDDVMIEVADTGSGIEPEELPQVFDRFWRAEKSRSRRGGGSGLGLSIVRQLIDAHRGTVTATSVPGTETVFTLRLPAGS